MRTNLTFKQERITPERARAILQNMPRNRNVSPWLVKRLAKMVRRGEWVIAQPLLFDENDLLLDGQHRLMAVESADRSADFACIYGYDREATFKVLDRGRVRNNSDIMSCGGIEDAKTMAPATRVLWALEHGVNPAKASLGSQNPRPDLNEILDYFDRFEKPLQEAHRDLPKNFRASPFPRTWAVGIYAHLRGGDRVAVLDYLCAVTSGEALMSRDPAFVVREKLTQDRAKKWGKKLSETERLAWLSEGWNWTAKGLSVGARKKMQIRRDRLVRFVGGGMASH